MDTKSVASPAETDANSSIGRECRSPLIRGTLQRATLASALTLVFLGIFIGLGWYWFGSVARASAYIRGERLYIPDRAMSLGDIPVNTKLTISYSVTNLSGRPIKLLGAQPSCSCTMIPDLPFTLGASETRSIPVAVDTSEAGKDAIIGTVDVFTDDPEVRTFRLAFAGRIVAARAADIDAGR